MYTDYYKKIMRTGQKLPSSVPVTTILNDAGRHLAIVASSFDLLSPTQTSDDGANALNIAARTALPSHSLPDPSENDPWSHQVAMPWWSASPNTLVVVLVIALFVLLVVVVVIVVVVLVFVYRRVNPAAVVKRRLVENGGTRSSETDSSPSGCDESLIKNTTRQLDELSSAIV